MTPKRAYLKALKDGPSDKTRKVVCKSPLYAYEYALKVDLGPHDDTREAACKDAQNAYEYARDIDRGFHEKTWETLKGTAYEAGYKEKFGDCMKENLNQ